ncbi:MAG: FAD binding domain-containing protein [Acidobacteriota bacterium]|nr:FAD binding domain-containing protein [Acidobacteriota bacterium]
MRSNVSEYDLIAPPTLTAVLDTLASDHTLTPIAGGTELMVALSAGRLAQKNFVSINHLEELRFIEVSRETVILGSGTTFTDIRKHPVMASYFPLLVQAASWTGSIANQNRGTLGGNIVNASPAADSPPALLAYDAILTLISAAGTRTILYRDFHRSYKKTALLPGELLFSIRLERRYTGYITYTRKVGTRNAQAISKVALACLARMEPDPTNKSNRQIQDIRIGAASLRETPTRCIATEQTLLGQPINADTIAAARRALASEAQPIDDIRSTAKYRAAVAGNLLEEFLLSLAP